MSDNITPKDTAPNSNAGFSALSAPPAPAPALPAPSADEQSATMNSILSGTQPATPTYGNATPYDLNVDGQVFPVPNPPQYQAPAPEKPQSKWAAILQGALTGLAGGAAGKNFGQGMALGAKKVEDLAQQKFDNRQREEDQAQRKYQMDSNIWFQNLESAHRAASLAMQDKQLHLQTAEAQDRHDLAQQNLVKFNMEYFGTAYDKTPNTGASATTWLEQGTTNARAAGQQGVTVHPGTVLTSRDIYVPKPGVNTISQQYDQAKTYSEAMQVSVPTESAFQTAGSDGRSKMIESLEYRLRGLDPRTGEYYQHTELPGAVSAMNTAIKAYEKKPVSGAEAQKKKESLLTIMRDSRASMQDQLNNYRSEKANDAKVSARAQVDALANATPPAPPDPGSSSILKATGLSMPAFAVITGNAGQLPRDKATRQKAMADAEKWANDRGVDVSTIASQYKTYNDVLSKNIERLNNTKIMEQEVDGTVDILKDVVKDADLSRLKIANVAKVWAGQEVNDPLAQQYALHLRQLRTDLTAYFAATQGRTGSSITVQDQQEAEMVIKNGLSTKSLNGLKTAIANSTTKMGAVMDRSVRTARQNVWGLFGVSAEQYDKSHPDPSKPNLNQTNPNQAPNPKGARPQGW